MPAYQNLREVFDAFTDLEVDMRFAQRVMAYVQRFLTKNDTHTEFFGNMLVGVYPVRYVPDDESRWLEEIMGIEEVEDCQEAVYLALANSYDEKVQKFRTWNIGPSVTNQSFLYLIYRIQQSKLSATDKHELQVNVVIMNMAKHLCSLLTQRFRFPADPLVAQALIEALDNRTDLKVAGSWLAWMREKAEMFLDKQRGIHHDAVMAYDGDVALIGAANDIQDRLASVLNILTSKFHTLKDAQAKILTSSAFSTIDGEKVLRDYQSNTGRLVTDMQAIAADPNNFIRKQLVEETCKVVTTAEPRFLQETLDYFADNFKTDERMRALIQEIVVYVVTAAREERLNLTNIPAVIHKVRATYRSSQLQRKDVLSIKAKVKDITREALPKPREAVITSTQVALFVYIVLRILTIPYYK